MTKDEPYRAHPHNLVGKEGCKNGICTMEINNETMTAVFSNLGIQCVKKKDIEEALKTREEIRVDPFRRKRKISPAINDICEENECEFLILQRDLLMLLILVQSTLMRCVYVFKHFSMVLNPRNSMF